MTSAAHLLLPPGSTIGIIGGGQLGRMLCIAAAQLGYRCHVYAPEKSGPAADVCARWVQGGYDDTEALLTFSSAVSAVTFEFENIDPEPLRPLSLAKPFWPPLKALEIGQDRIAEKRFAEELGGRTAHWAAVNSIDDLETAIKSVGTPSILKTVRFGYDGKGQARLKTPADGPGAWATIGQAPAILEAMVDFDHEYSLIIARDQNGATQFWDTPKNVHKDGILDTSSLPAPKIIEQQLPAARALARKIAEKLCYVGVFTIEFFAGIDGPVFNEMAPRVHNSGHWTIEGAVTSQFENHIRAVVGLPLGPTSKTSSNIRMQNLIGADIDHWLAHASDPGAHLHLYGKKDARPGRKMGHVTWVG